jgi:hypothetical protein
MSKIALSGNASGTGTFTIASPDSNSDRTLNLPDNSGTVLTSASSIAASQLGSQFSVSSSAPSSSLVMDASGRVTMPFQPAISIGINQQQITDVAGTNLFGVSGRTYVVDTAVGITHNTTNGRFTVPIAGRYLVSFYTMKENAGVAYLDINVNDASWLRPYSATNAVGWTAYSTCGIRNLAAGDYITPKVIQNSATAVAHGLEHMRLVIQLIG